VPGTSRLVRQVFVMVLALQRGGRDASLLSAKRPTYGMARLAAMQGVFALS